MSATVRSSLLYLFLLPLIAGAGHAQSYDVRVYSVEHGLAQSQVRAVLQDRRGYLWIGTLGGGVSRFDGREFTRFDRSQGLAHNIVRTIFEDRAGRLWFGTDRGASRYDGERFRNFGPADGLAGEEVRAIAQDRAGDLWFGTDRGVSRYDGERFHGYDGVAGEKVLTILEDRGGRLWLGTENGVRRYDGDGFETFPAVDSAVHALLEDRRGEIWLGTGNGVLRYDGKAFAGFATGSGLATLEVKCLLEDREGDLWFGTGGGGVFIYDGERLDRLTERHGLSSDSVWALEEDREGNVWIGTYRGGLCQFRGRRFVHYSTRDGLSDDVVRAIHEDRDGDLWFGTYRGGVSRFDGTRFTRLTTEDGLIHDFVLAIAEDRGGNLWFGTFGGASRYDGASFTHFTPERGLGGSVVRAIVEDRAGRIWFGTNSGGVSIYDGSEITTLTTEDGLTHDSVMTLLLDRDGGVWIGTLGGIDRHDGERLVDFSAEHGLDVRDVMTIVQDDEGAMWFGVYGEGVVRYSPAAAARDDPAGAFERFSSRDGLADDGVVLTIFDDAGNLWIGTEKSVNRLDVARFRATGEKVFRRYRREDGFLGIECIHNAAAKDRRGNLWFGTLHGATRYDPRADRPSAVEPLVHLTGLRLFLEAVDLSPYSEGRENGSGLPIGLRLPHDQNHLTFDFRGLSLRVPEKVRYAFRLEGFDEAWSPAVEDRRATYANLPPGRYEFAVRARNGDGVWSRSPATFRFAIEPPWWRTWWFRGTLVLSTLAAALTFHVLRVGAAERRKRELEREVAERTAEVVRQKREIEDKNAELERFVYTVSHDLKSPLITIRGFLGLLERDVEAGATRQVRHDIERIYKAAGKMARLLDELLELSRIGRLVNRPEAVAMSELAREAVDQVTGEITRAGVEVRIEPDQPSAYGDRQRLLEVYQNLISNAVKYLGDQPRPRIEIGCRRDGSEPAAGTGRGEAVFYVRDNGMGIDPRYHEKIFGLFERLDQKIEGTGVGLALVKRIVEVHGGRVWVESRGEGRGSTFCFALPTPPPAPRRSSSSRLRARG